MIDPDDRRRAPLVRASEAEQERRAHDIARRRADLPPPLGDVSAALAARHALDVRRGRALALAPLDAPSEKPSTRRRLTARKTNDAGDDSRAGHGGRRRRSS